MWLLVSKRKCSDKWLEDCRHTLCVYSIWFLYVGVKRYTAPWRNLKGTNTAVSVDPPLLSPWGEIWPMHTSLCKMTQSNQIKDFSQNENFNIVLILWPTDCTQFFSSETCSCECQWTGAEQSRMQLITEHLNVPSAAFYIITSNCHLVIHISFIYVLLIWNFFAVI